MWEPSIDFIYGLATGIGIWISIELIRTCHAKYEKQNIFNETFDTILAALEIHQQSLAQLYQQMQERREIQILPVIQLDEPGFNA